MLHNRITVQLLKHEQILSLLPAGLFVGNLRVEPPCRAVPSQKGGLNSPWHRLGSTMLSSSLSTCGPRWPPPPWAGTEGPYTAFSMPLGLLLKLPFLDSPPDSQCFEDQVYWEVRDTFRSLSPEWPLTLPLCYLALPWATTCLFPPQAPLEVPFIPPCFAGTWRAGG